MEATVYEGRCILPWAKDYYSQMSFQASPSVFWLFWDRCCGFGDRSRRWFENRFDVCCEEDIFFDMPIINEVEAD